MKHGILQARPPETWTEKGEEPTAIRGCCGRGKVRGNQVRCRCGKFLARIVNGLAYRPPRSMKG